MISKLEKDDDYRIFSDEERIDLIKKYVGFISELGFKPIKVLGRKDPTTFYSFRGLFVFNKEVEKGVVRKHTAFFEARNFSDFSLKKFKEDVEETTEMDALENFKRALKVRIWNSGFTDEEILCAILPRNLSLRVSDVYIDGEVVIPPEILPDLFNEFNYKGGYPTSSRIKRPNQPQQPRR
jgi:hypothetical protein